MATGTLLTVLTHIPWGQVVDKAPKLADGAARLWSSVSQRKKEPATPQDAHAPAAERLEARIAALEDSVSGLQEQMQASSALIKELADQNRLLVERVQWQRTVSRRWGLAGAGALALLAAVLTFALVRL
ncbi:MAG: hypothetical protein KGL43_20230 [Burkholderiales bacterium]|nr:hypothetical protein [Burkholderiales bacterium]MDE2396980.1 hypothetical protein [Burkholderiales bacterium]MDE2455925.1 hypothetical protein [Burkholderiales bacterium]